MCITLEPATLASTILLAHQVEHEGKPVNVVGYQNSAESLGSGPNAMILPIPSAVPMTQANCIDMTGAKKVFRDYEDVVRPRTRGMSKGFLGAAAAADGLQVFDSGSYTVVLTKQFDIERLRDVLAALPEDKRIDLTLPKMEIFAAFRNLYPDWHLAICVWNGKVEAEPIMWWYDPMPEFVDNHFLPGLDAHDGNPPVPNDPVEIDHTLITSIASTNGYQNASDLVAKAPAHLRKWLPTHVAGTLLHGDVANNGDWVFPKKLDNLWQVGGKRTVPPGHKAA